MSVGARYKVLCDADVEDGDTNPDWVVLDIPPAAVEELYQKMLSWKRFVDSGLSVPQSLLTVHLHVEREPT